MPHQIRLAGPWEYSTDNGETWQRSKLPFHFSECGADACLLRRRFHRPTGLDADSIVSLQMTGQHLPTSLQLNDQDTALTLNEQEAETSNLTEQLLSFNEVCLSASAESETVLESAVIKIAD